METGKSEQWSESVSSHQIIGGFLFSKFESEGFECSASTFSEKACAEWFRVLPLLEIQLRGHMTAIKFLSNQGESKGKWKKLSPQGVLKAGFWVCQVGHCPICLQWDSRTIPSHLLYETVQIMATHSDCYCFLGIKFVGQEFDALGSPLKWPILLLCFLRWWGCSPVCVSHFSKSHS